MDTYYVKRLVIRNLWGYRCFDLYFNKDVNIIIGPNASGKTTILNLLRYVLTADVFNLKEVDFEEIVVTLAGFEDNSYKELMVRNLPNQIVFSYDNNEFIVDYDPILRREYQSGLSSYQNRTRRKSKNLDLESNIKKLVNAVWLPVSRRLPVTDEDEEYRLERYRSTESVDERLKVLLESLTKYRLMLEGRVSEKHKEFERRVLEAILYDKNIDQIDIIKIDPPSDEDKGQLIAAFEVAGLLDSSMRKRIEEHFVTAKAISKKFGKVRKPGSNDIAVSDLFIIPLINRTRQIVQYAKELDQQRKLILDPIKRFEQITKSFLKGKQIVVEDTGLIRIQSSTQKQDLQPQVLSSGEKQILILLIQAVLSDEKPMVYVVDEPELSLHVNWQENLMKSLLNLGQNIQIIVATHSPEIVGPYLDKVIDLAEE